MFNEKVFLSFVRRPRALCLFDPSADLIMSIMGIDHAETGDLEETLEATSNIIKSYNARRHGPQ